MNDDYKYETDYKLIWPGVALFILGALLLIFAPLDTKACVGVGVIFVVAFGLCAGGSPTQKKE